MRKVLCLAVILLLTNVAYSAEQSIEINTEMLTVGMPEPQVSKKLEDYYRLNCKEGKVKSCVLTSKDGPPYSAIANIVFEKGKISSVRKYWSDGYEGTDPSQFVKTLYYLLSNLSKDGPVNVTLSTGENKEPGFVIETISINKDNKTISISVTEGLKLKKKRIPTFTNLVEVIE